MALSPLPHAPLTPPQLTHPRRPRCAAARRSRQTVRASTLTDAWLRFRGRSAESETVPESPPAPPVVATYNALAWRLDAVNPQFPEETLPELQARPNIGIAFSGGGSRAYVAALAQLAALRELGLLSNVRYVTGVSGGAWAAAVYTFYQPGGLPPAAPPESPLPPPLPAALDPSPEGPPLSDDELFGGPPAPPESLTLAALAEMSPRCARGFVCRGALLDEAAKALQGGRPAEDAWRAALYRVIFRPAGIPEHGPFTWSAQHAEAIAARNPGVLRSSDFLVPAGGPAVEPRPYLIVGVTTLGPLALVPHRPLHLRAYTLLQVTPLYTGFPRALHVRYTSSIPGLRTRRASRLLGGVLESFAFGGSAPPPKGLAGARCGALQVPVAPPLSLPAACAASSFAPGGVLATQLPSRRVSRLLGVTLPYWSPMATNPRPTELLHADGGCVVNPDLMSLLQRRVSTAVVFCNFQTPLAPRAVYDPFARPPTPADVSEDLPSFFGYVLDSVAWSYARNAVFPRADFARVVDALQRAQATGRGAVATLEHVTVANAWWGVPAGHRVTVTWAYLTAAPAWEAALPEETRALLRDPKNARLGPRFPHIGTLELALTAQQVNLVHHLSAWVVASNRELFQAALRAREAAAAV